MKEITKSVTVNTREFRAEVEWAARFVETKSTIPVLACLKLAMGNAIVTATDLVVGATTRVEVELTSGLEQSLCIPAKPLLKYLKAVDDTAIRLECRPGSTNALFVVHGDSEARFNGGLSVESYPELPVIKHIGRIAGLDVAIPRILTTVSQKETRFTLNGALLETDENDVTRIVSTDGHRLGVHPVTCSPHGRMMTRQAAVVLGEEPAKPQPKVMVPKAALPELAKLGDRLTFGKDDNHISFSNGHRTVLSRLMTGSFPDWRRVLPRNFTAARTVSDIPATTKAIKRLLLLADERSHACQMELVGETMLLTTINRGDMNGTTRIPVAFDRSLTDDMGPSAWNMAYVVEFLSKAGVCAEPPKVRLQTPGQACEWSTADGWQYILMPMRLEAL